MRSAATPSLRGSRSKTAKEVNTTESSFEINKNDVYLDDIKYCAQVNSASWFLAYRETRNKTTIGFVFLAASLGGTSLFPFASHGNVGFFESPLRWLTKMLPESVSSERLKSHLHPLNSQRSKRPRSRGAIKLDVSTFTEANQPGMQRGFSKGTASPNSQPRASPAASRCQTKMTTVKRDL